jgi:hypothetical protein
MTATSVVKTQLPPPAKPALEHRRNDNGPTKERRRAADRNWFSKPIDERTTRIVTLHGSMAIWRARDVRLRPDRGRPAPGFRKLFGCWDQEPVAAYQRANTPLERIRYCVGDWRLWIRNAHSFFPVRCSRDNATLSYRGKRSLNRLVADYDPSGVFVMKPGALRPISPSCRSL